MKYSKSLVESAMKISGVTYAKIASLSGYSEDFVRRVVKGERNNRDGSIERTIDFLMEKQIDIIKEADNSAFASKSKNAGQSVMITHSVLSGDKR